MRIFEDVRTVTESFTSLVLTIGSFDGVHLGHQRIIDEVCSTAHRCGGTPALMTLDPHPRQYFTPAHAPNILTTLKKKLELIAECGIETCFILPFEASVAAMDRRDFLEEIVLKRCQAQHIIVGHDFSFGKGAQGNYAYLAAAAPGCGFAVKEVPPLILQGERVSSTLIRERILQGDLEDVERLLRRKYAIRGAVIRGRGMGVQLGFPTANIHPGNCALPAFGIYAAIAFVDGAAHHAAVNVGIAPTIRHDEPMVEAHLLDYAGDLVGKEVEVEFHARIRGEKKFESHEALVRAIDQDVRAIRVYFGVAQ
ncbi:MAG: bifunctional riboflavin kinase/FAD synthetase [Candidatus Hydrogenedentes bacterium]|nr:bifunctional riboflavin kinase/FAD synthetase [Candidatus Hydrogenedentota bacterium]